MKKTVFLFAVLLAATMAVSVQKMYSASLDKSKIHLLCGSKK